MKDNIIRTAVCPLCGRTYHGAPALSREDNKTLICPDCGTFQPQDVTSRHRGAKPLRRYELLGGARPELCKVYLETLGKDS